MARAPLASRSFALCGGTSSTRPRHGSVTSHGSDGAAAHGNRNAGDVRRRHRTLVQGCDDSEGTHEPRTRDAPSRLAPSSFLRSRPADRSPPREPRTPGRRRRGHQGRDGRRGDRRRLHRLQDRRGSDPGQVVIAIGAPKRPPAVRLDFRTCKHALIRRRVTR